MPSHSRTFSTRRVRRLAAILLHRWQAEENRENSVPPRIAHLDQTLRSKQIGETTCFVIDSIKQSTIYPPQEFRLLLCDLVEPTVGISEGRR